MPIFWNSSRISIIMMCWQELKAFFETLLQTSCNESVSIAMNLSIHWQGWIPKKRCSDLPEYGNWGMFTCPKSLYRASLLLSASSSVTANFVSSTTLVRFKGGSSDFSSSDSWSSSSSASSSESCECSWLCSSMSGSSTMKKLVRKSWNRCGWNGFLALQLTTILWSCQSLVIS